MRKKKNPGKIEAFKKIGITSWSIIGLLILVALFFYVIYLIRIAVIPLIIAAGIAYLLTPLVLLLKRKMRKVFAVAITYVIFSGVIFVILFFIIPLFIDQGRIFLNRLPIYINNVSDVLNDFLANSPVVENIENVVGKDFIPNDMNAVTQSFLSSIDLENLNIFQSAGTFTRSIFNILITFIIGPLLGIYALKDTDKMRQNFLRPFSPRIRRDITAILDKINNVAGRYIRGQILVSIIVGLLCTIALIILRVDFAFLLGVIAGVFNMIPFLGPFIGAVPAALTALFISPLKAILVILIFVGIQQLDNYVISPNIMKYQVGVHPGIVIFSLLAAGAVFGVIGLLLAVPTVAVLQEVIKYYFLERRRPRPGRSP